MKYYMIAQPSRYITPGLIAYFMLALLLA